MDLEVVDSVRGLRALEPEWNELLGDSASDGIFLTWEWMWSWWRSLAPATARPWLLTARAGADRTLLGLTPTMLRGYPHRWGPYRELSFMGAGLAAGDHLDWIVRRRWEVEVGNAFLRRLREAPCDVLNLEGIASASALAAGLLSSDAPRARHVSRQRCPFMELPESWDALEASLSRKMRYNLRSRTRRLESHAGDGAKYHTVDRASDIESGLGLLFDFKEGGAEDAGKAIRFPPRFKTGFHPEVAKCFFERGWLRLHLLSVNSRPVAVSYCYLYRGTLSFYQTAFDHSWSAYGVGASITAYSVREAIREGATGFDFLRGGELYKRQWTRQSRDVLKIRAATTSLGTLAVAAFRAARHVRHRVRPRD